MREIRDLFWRVTGLGEELAGEGKDEGKGAAKG